MQDHLGGTNIVTDDTGAVEEIIEYQPFGKKARHDNYVGGAVSANHYFTGHFEDAESGLIFMGARYYDPELGRFLTADTIVQDPSNPQTFNRYSYTANNPINFIDPDGHIFWFAAFAFVAKAAAVVSTISTIAGIATGNATLLKIGRIAGYIGIGASLANIGITIAKQGLRGAISKGMNAALASSKSSSYVQVASEGPVQNLAPIVITATKTAAKAGGGSFLGNVFRQAAGSTIAGAVSAASVITNAVSGASALASSSAVSAGLGALDKAGKLDLWGKAVAFNGKVISNSAQLLNPLKNLGRVASRLSPGVFVGTTGAEIYGALRGPGNWAQRVSKAFVVGTFNTGAYAAGVAIVGAGSFSVYGVGFVGGATLGVGFIADNSKRAINSFIDKL